MQKKSKLMIYVQSDVAAETIRWAIRLSQTTPGLCNACIGWALQNMERGLSQSRDIPPRPWDWVDVWKLSQGKPIESKLPESTVRRAQAQHQGAYREAQAKLRTFEKALKAGKADTKIVFQVQEGPDGDRWPEKIRRIAPFFQIKPNELVNRMIAAGLAALDREDPLYEPDFVADYRSKVLLPKIEEFLRERELAGQFDIHAGVPQELASDSWAFVGLTENANLHYRELVDGYLRKKTPEEALFEIAQDRTLSLTYFDRLKGIYASPAYQDDWRESRPLRDKRLKKEIIDALVEEWRRTAVPPESSVVEEIKSRLLGLTDDGLKILQAEIGILLSTRGPQKKPRPRK